MYINNTLGNRNGVSDPLSLTAKKAMFFGLLVFGFQIQYQGCYATSGSESCSVVKPTKQQRVLKRVLEPCSDDENCLEEDLVCAKGVCQRITCLSDEECQHRMRDHWRSSAPKDNRTRAGRHYRCFMDGRCRSAHGACHDTCSCIQDYGMPPGGTKCFRGFCFYKNGFDAATRIPQSSQAKIDNHHRKPSYKESQRLPSLPLSPTKASPMMIPEPGPRWTRPATAATSYQPSWSPPSSAPTPPSPPSRTWSQLPARIWTPVDPGRPKMWTPVNPGTTMLKMPVTGAPPQNPGGQTWASRKAGQSAHNMLGMRMGAKSDPMWRDRRL